MTRPGFTEIAERAVKIHGPSCYLWIVQCHQILPEHFSWSIGLEYHGFEGSHLPEAFFPRHIPAFRFCHDWILIFLLPRCFTADWISWQLLGQTKFCFISLIIIWGTRLCCVHRVRNYSHRASLTNAAPHPFFLKKFFEDTLHIIRRSTLCNLFLKWKWLEIFEMNVCWMKIYVNSVKSSSCGIR